MISAIILATTSTLLFIFAQSVPVLLTARFISGLGSGLLTGAATAALAELEPKGSPQRAARVATAANMGGLGLGPLVAGLFAQLAPDPTQLVFIVYLLFLFLCMGLVGFLPETVRSPDHVFDIRPRLGVAPSTRRIFVQAAITVFSVFTILGLFSALAPSFLRITLKVPNLIVAGAVVFLLFGIATFAQIGMHGLSSRTARLYGLVTLIIALGLIQLGLSLPNFTFFIAGTVIGGLGVGLAFMGSLAAINQVGAAKPSGRNGLCLLCGGLYRSKYSCGWRRIPRGCHELRCRNAHFGSSDLRSPSSHDSGFVLAGQKTSVKDVVLMTAKCNCEKRFY